MLLSPHTFAEAHFEVLINYMFQTLLYHIFFSPSVMFSHAEQLRPDLCCNWQVKLCELYNLHYWFRQEPLSKLLAGVNC